MQPTLEEVVYDLARAALDEQRELVANLRSRAAPVLAGAGAVAAILARPAVHGRLSFSRHARNGGLVALGIIAAVISLLGSILVLARPDVGFSVDIEALYPAAFGDRGHPEIHLVRIAESRRLRRVANRAGVRWMRRCLAAALVGLLIEVIGFGGAIAVD
jgi:hypothetical protein